MMKSVLILTILLSFVSCAVKPLHEIAEVGEPIVLNANKDYEKVYQLLADKMTNCYDQSIGTYHIMGVGRAEEKTLFSIDKENKSAIVYYQIKTEFKRDVLFYVKVQSRGPASSKLKVYGKGRGPRTQQELKDNLELWLKGKKAYCIGRGTF